MGIAHFHGHGTGKSLDEAWKYMSYKHLNDWPNSQYYRGLILSDAEFERADVDSVVLNLKSAAAGGVAAAEKKIEQLSSLTNNKRRKAQLNIAMLSHSGRDR